MLRHEHGRHLRLGRFSEIWRVYNVTSIIEDRRPIFEDWRLGRLVIDEFRRAEQQGLALSLAWVVMPDHFHWLLQLRHGSLDKVMKQVKARSAIEINRATHREGRLWQKGFHDRAVRHEDDLRKIARYIIANPLRAGLVEYVGDYSLWDAIWV
ncbi:REP-associated tyrosine transposase [Pseudomonas sp. NA-150]|uniref:REP-associated tyrosine transposase n=1 Tax=Pseudomonas sp. NA-150 TaxID=3367525 RepID=UPI0037CAC55D